jgi:hypothetical protein
MSGWEFPQPSKWDWVGPILFALFMLVLPGIAHGQAPLYPTPYVQGTLSLMPGGYAAVAVGGGAGIEWNTKHFILDSLAAYDNGHKTNDGTVDNRKGHDRYLRGLGSFKFGNNYIGAGARWSELSTTNYTKENSWHPELGVGHDFSFMRAQALWMFNSQHSVVDYPDAPSCYNTCGSQERGADLSFWYPSPASARHVFFRIDMVIFRFQNEPAATVVRQTSATVDFSLLYRF